MKKILTILFLVLASQAWGANPKFEKVFIVILENTNFIDATNQPYLGQLMKRGAILTDYLAITHPSYPNYIALTSGTTHGKHDDKLAIFNGPHIGDLLDQRGKSWKNYAENLPPGCPLINQGRFVARHVPFLSYFDLRQNPENCAKHVVDASQLDSDIQAGNLPDYSFYSPNLDNDGHDTNVGYASLWLSKVFAPRLSDPKFMKGLLFVITFDEDESYSGRNKVLTILIGDSVKSGATSGAHFTHYSLLRTIEDNFDLGSLNQNDLTASPIEGIWN